MHDLLACCCLLLRVACSSFGFRLDATTAVGMHGHSGPDGRHCSRVAFSPRPRSSRRTRDPNAPAPCNESHAATRLSGSTTRLPHRPKAFHARIPRRSARTTTPIGTHDTARGSTGAFQQLLRLGGIASANTQTQATRRAYPLRGPRTYNPGFNVFARRATRTLQHDRRPLGRPGG